MEKKTLVLGASLKTDRYSNYVIHKLIERSNEVVAIGLKTGHVAGVEIKTELSHISGIDTVTLYLNPLRQKSYYQYIIDLNPRRVIFNPGTENPELYDLLEEANIEAEVACTLVLLSTNQY
ncbi:CoA-binding protein [Aquimarina gracilis]|uniref:CoA-binding protein n=1 Tax=Aquimarina gracilis TaxID=874422 RepID=A0ABU5ZYN0_9FLAO|nr:CoA-binding protein [Aquimarina gracilis]MEB3346920.1 CoA-binding protein [Aquimarina gracilis]